MIDPLKPLTEVQSTKSLGIDERIVWEEHFESLCKCISSRLAVLKQASRFAPQDTVLNIYNAL